MLAMPAPTSPTAATTAIVPMMPFLSDGRRLINMPTTETTAAATINTIAPASLLIANITLENEKIITAIPMAAKSGYSIGFNKRWRIDALYATSPEPRSLQACTVHSTRAASIATIPKMKTTGVVMVPTSNNAKPAAPTSGHMLGVGVSTVAADVWPSGV